MPFKKQTHAPDNVTLLAAASRIASGELTRSSAAAELGVSLPYLVQWLGKNGLLDSLKHTRGNAGTHSHLAESNPDKVKAYAVLVDKAAASPKLKIAPLLKTGTFTSNTGQVMAFAGLVNYQVLARRIKAHR